ncbi:MAG: hypothetical protein GY797_29200 [Deltaproteobacteria bacterium]|nr:hypothetical protein [Deltaproteobacteria bacterium]
MSIPTPAQAYWHQRFALADCKERVLSLVDSVGHPTDLQPFQWAQLMTFAMEFKPDLILELGRGRGNSTCAFTEVANQLKPLPCQVLSVCLSDGWEWLTLPKLNQLVPETWFEPLQVVKANILAFDYKLALSDFERVLIFWDAHGYDIAECVLGKILPEIAERPHVVIMHDLSDTRYMPESRFQYNGHSIWKGNTWDGSRLIINPIHTAVEQAVAIIDFTNRNKLPLHSASHNLHTKLGLDKVKLTELKESLGDSLFSLDAHWFWFSLNEISGPYTFPRFCGPTPAKVSLKTRLKVAIKVLLNRYPAERFLH